MMENETNLKPYSGIPVLEHPQDTLLLQPRKDLLQARPQLRAGQRRVVHELHRREVLEALALEQRREPLELGRAVPCARGEAEGERAQVRGGDFREEAGHGGARGLERERAQLDARRDVDVALDACGGGGLGG